MHLSKKTVNFVDTSIIKPSMSENKKLDEIYLFQLDKVHKQFKKYKKAYFKAKGIDLSSDQWIILKRIYENEGINQRELAKSAYKEPASITRMLDILEKKAWVTRQNAPNDRRTYEMHLTPEGKTLVEQILPMAVDIRAQGVKGFSEEEITQFKGFLEKVFDNFS